MKELIIATKNKGKATEFKEFFSPFSIRAISLLELSKPIPDVEETGNTFTDNARLKAEEIASHLNVPVLSDDSGLIIDAIDGRPGIYSARYAGVPSNDQANIDKVMSELNDIEYPKRKARFICVIAIAIPNEETVFHTGYCEGTIALEQEGVNGFGYDPIFIPDGYTKTMAQITADEKNRLSHRNNAMLKVKEWIKRY